jgi:hypothetical protein
MASLYLNLISDLEAGNLSYLALANKNFQTKKDILLLIHHNVLAYFCGSIQ